MEIFLLAFLWLIALIIEPKEPYLVLYIFSTLLAPGSVPETHDIAIYLQSPKLTFDLAQIHDCTSIRPTLLTNRKCDATFCSLKFSCPCFRSSDGCEEAAGPRLLKEDGMSPDHFWHILQVCRLFLVDCPSTDFFIFCPFLFIFISHRP